MDGKEVAPHGNKKGGVSNADLLKALEEGIDGKRALQELDKRTKRLLNSEISIEYVTTQRLLKQGIRDIRSPDCLGWLETFNIRRGTRSSAVMDIVKKNILRTSSTIIVSFSFLIFYVFFVHAASKHILHQSTQYTLLL